MQYNKRRKQLQKAVRKPTASVQPADQNQQKIIRALVDRIVMKESIAPAGYRQGMGIARYLDVDSLHTYLMQAEARNVTGLFTIMRDMIAGGGHVTSVYAQRKLSVLGEGWKIEPADRDDQQAVWMADQLEAEMEEKGALYINTFAHLLGGSMWPCSVVGKVFKRSTRPGWLYEIEDFYPVQPIAFNYSMDPAGRLELYKAGEDGMILTGQTIKPDQSEFIIHKATLLTEVPEYFGGLLRPVLFWYLFATMGRDWWARFLNRFGSPFIQGTYDPNDPESQFQLEAAMSAAQELFGVVIPESTSVQLVQAATSQNGDAYSAFHSVANAEISKILLGQTLSADAQNIGFGGGQASVQNDVRNEIKAFDALMLGHTFRQYYLNQLCKINGWPVDKCPVCTFNAASNEDIQALADLLGKLKTAGLRLADGALEDIAIKFGYALERDPAAETGAGGFGGLFSSARAVHDQTVKPVAEVSPQSSEAVATTPLQAEPEKKAAPDRNRALNISDASQKANDGIIAASLQPMAKALGKQADAILKIANESTSRADFLSRLDKLDLEIDPDGIDILADAMSSAAVNGILTVQPRLGRKT